MKTCYLKLNKDINLCFQKIKYDNDVEFCSEELIIESNFFGNLKLLQVKKELKSIIINDRNMDYYFLYSYELDIKKSKNKNVVHDLFSIYIGKGTLQRTLKYKRDFHMLNTYQRLERNTTIYKKIIGIIRSTKGIKTNKELNKIITAIGIETNLIGGEHPIFNKQDNKHYDWMKIVANCKNFYVLFNSDIPIGIELTLKDALEKSKKTYTIISYNDLNISQKYIVKNFLLYKKTNGHTIDIFGEFKVFDNEFTSNDFFLEYSKSYRSIKKMRRNK